MLTANDNNGLVTIRAIVDQEKSVTNRQKLAYQIKGLLALCDYFDWHAAKTMLIHISSPPGFYSKPSLHFNPRAVQKTFRKNASKSSRSHQP